MKKINYQQAANDDDELLKLQLIVRKNCLFTFKTKKWANNTIHRNENEFSENQFFVLTNLRHNMTLLTVTESNVDWVRR